MADKKKPDFLLPTDCDCQQALEAVIAGRLYGHGLYIRIPRSLFDYSIRSKNYPFPAISLYVFENEKIRLLRPERELVDENILNNYEMVWIKEEDLPIIRKYSEEVLLATKGTLKTLPTTKRIEIIRRSAIAVVEDLFVKPTAENLDRSKKIVGSFVQLIMQDPRAYLMLAQLSSHDHYTLQHSVGTAVNSIILAKKIGIANEQDLNNIGLAGLLHDIGKVTIKSEIINKKGPLSESEWAEMILHPLKGFEIVKDNPGIAERSKRAILEHHEDKEGTGYPNRLKQEQIDLFSNIVGLCDVFNALTTDRSYSKARTVFDALELIRDKMHHKVDADLFAQLVLIYGGKV
ncbi:MAG: hypothetical protein A3K03_07815 [Bdellovibrionales bacterium RIFOXYD1_FULL_44_7]|nr:MAG: hypothetical protein A3K03_07815 [Bdellovibrionales bacterium RIFOXYD1_FULL_44_7]